MATTKARSIGTKTAYSTGTIATDATGLIVTLTGGTFDSDWGEGDLLKINTDAAFSNDFSDDFDSETWAYVLTRTDATHLVLQTAVTPSLSGETFSIERSYSTLTTWDAACPADLVTDDSIWKGVGYNDSTFTVAVTISGITTDATRYVWLTVADGHWHQGTKTGCVVNMGGAATTPINAASNYCLIEKWRVTGYTSSGAGPQAGISNGSLSAKTRFCFVHDVSSTSSSTIRGISLGTSDTHNIVENSIVLNITGTVGIVMGILAQGSSNTRNCTVYNCTSTSNNAYGLWGSYAESIYNNIITNCTTACYTSASPLANAGGNVASDTSLTTYGIGGTRLESTTAASLFVSITPGSEDLSLKSTSPAIAFGINLGTYFTTDIKSNSRYYVWDAGAFRYSVVETKHRSIGNSSVQTPYSTGTVSCTDGYNLELTGGSFNANWGEGDRVTIDGVAYFVTSRTDADTLFFNSPLPLMTGKSYVLERAYTALSVWESESPANLVTDNSIWKGVCYSDSTFGETNINITGITADAARYIHLTAAVGHRHEGSRQGVLIDGGGASTTIISVNQSNVIVEYLRFTGLQGTGAGMRACIAVETYSNVHIRQNMICDISASSGNSIIHLIAGSGGAGAAISIYNNLIVNCEMTGTGSCQLFGINASSGSTKVYNNVVLNLRSTSSCVGIQCWFGTSYNNISMNHTGVSSSACFSGSSGYNMSSDATATGTKSIINMSTVDQFVSITTGSEDVHLKVGSGAIGTGINLSSTFNFDIVGSARSSFSWDMGVFTYTTARYWVGVDTSWNTSANWSATSGGTGGAGVPDATTDAIFDANSSSHSHCVGDADMDCVGMQMLGCSNNFSDGGYDLTTLANCYIATTGTITFTGTYTMIWGSTFTLTSGVGVLTVVDGTFSFLDNATVAISKTGYTWGVLQGGANGKTVTKSGTTALAFMTLEFLGSGTITWAGILNLNSLTPFINTTGGVFNNTATFTRLTPSTSGTVTLNAGNYSSYFELYTTGSGSIIYNQVGDFTCRRFQFYKVNNESATYNTQNYNITITVDYFQIRSGGALHAGSLIFNAGSSTITANSYIDFNAQAGDVEVNMGTAIFKFKTNFTAQVIGYLTVTSTDSVIEAIGTAAQTMSFAGVTFDKIKNSNVTSTLSMLDALSCDRLLLEPLSTTRFKEGLTHTIASYTAGDWDGTAGNLVTIKSITDTAQHFLTVPDGIYVYYVDVRDSHVN